MRYTKKQEGECATYTHRMSPRDAFGIRMLDLADKDLKQLL